MFELTQSQEVMGFTLAIVMKYSAQVVGTHVSLLLSLYNAV